MDKKHLEGQFRRGKGHLKLRPLGRAADETTVARCAQSIC
jgi:hypothetical protein